MFDYVEEKLETLVKILFWLMSSASVMGFFAYSIMITAIINVLDRGNDEGSGITTFVFIVFGLIATAVSIGVYYISTLTVLSYLNLVEFSRKTANKVDELNEKMERFDIPTKPVAVTEATKSVKQGEWKCSKCGKVNPNFVGTCSCGQSRI